MTNTNPILRPLIVSAMLMAWSACVASVASDRPPNVIIVLVDDLGARDLGCFGSVFYETPHIDRLAAGGMRFTSAYAAAAVCSPTRASIMTGRYPARLGITDWIKLVRFFHAQNRDEFYDLEADPEESRNLIRRRAGKEETGPVLETLRAEMDRWMKSIDDWLMLATEIGRCARRAVSKTGA